MHSEDRLLKTMAAVLGVDALAETDSPATVAAWDSVNHLNLVMALEAEFGVRLSPDDALAMPDVASVRRIVRERGGEA